jgi:hypothetical protein
MTKIIKKKILQVFGIIKKCKKCQESKKGEMISFQHEKINFRVLKSAGQCNNCVKKKWSNFFDYIEICPTVVSSSGKSIPNVNWKRFWETFKNLDEKRQKTIAKLLVAIGVLSYKHRKGHVFYGVTIGYYKLYFVRQEDADEYAKICPKK